ncbi:MAG: hypothetical protein R2853_09320 [Thermomicrobiales bacterium]
MVRSQLWRYLLPDVPLGVGRYSVAHAILWGAMSLSGLLPGLIARAFFDDTAGAAPRTGRTGLILLLAALALQASGALADRGLRRGSSSVSGPARCCCNLLARLPSAAQAPGAPVRYWETISRFRDDAAIAEGNLDPDR